MVTGYASDYLGGKGCTCLQLAEQMEYDGIIGTLRDCHLTYEAEATWAGNKNSL